MMARLDLDAIRASNPLPAVVGAVAKLKAVGREWKACCPLHNERTPSFTIFDGGKRYQCFGCGAGGDVIDFVQALHGVGLRDAAAMLGVGDLPTVKVSASSQEAVNSDRTADALAIWEAAEPVDGTVAETYLRSRGITIPAPISLRYAELPYGRRGPLLPCLVACVSSPEGPLSGIQRTYLAADGNGKADVPAPKLSLGKLSGGAIRLAGHSGELVVCEGMEDGLSLLQLIDRPVWVAAGASNLATMRFPATVERVTIGGDNDDAGKEAARKAAERFAVQGVETRVFFPSPCFKDFNDELRGCRT